MANIRGKILDTRDSIFSVIRGLNPTSQESVVALCNVLGAVIAERTHNNPEEEARLITIVTNVLPRYVEAYRQRDNPLRRS